MRIRLLNWQGEPSFVTIDDSTKYIDIVLNAGDMVMTYPTYYDSGKDTRIKDNITAKYRIPKDKFSLFNKISTRKDLQEMPFITKLL